MPLTRELELNAKDEINDSINMLIDRYLKEGVSIYDLQRYFKPQKMFNILLKDIHFSGRKYFQEGEDYDGYVRKMLNNNILDRISEIETNKLSEMKIIKFNNFLNESLNFDDITIDYLYNDVNHTTEEMDIIATHFNTRKEYIKSKNPKYNTYTVTDFKTDVLNNSRTSFDVLILDVYQINTMKENLVKHIISGIYSNIPQEVEYMGVKIKLHSVIDKQSIKDSIKSMITEKEILDLISKLTQYVYDNKYGNCYIWKKIK